MNISTRVQPSIGSPPSPLPNAQPSTRNNAFLVTPSLLTGEGRGEVTGLETRDASAYALVQVEGGFVSLPDMAAINRPTKQLVK